VNFLAHLLLGGHDSESMAGSILGDFVRGGIEDRFPPAIEDAIRLHREIDDFTDHNLHWMQSRSRLSEPRRRYAGVIVDVFYDHLLCRRWDELAEAPLDRFIARSYRALARHLQHYDGKGREVVGWLIEEDWLSRYPSCEGLARTFVGLSRRTARSGVMLGSEEELFADLEAYESDFAKFWPELEAFVAEARRSMAAARSGSD